MDDMKIYWREEEHKLSPEDIQSIASSLRVFIEQQYDKLTDGQKVAAMAVTRTLLAKAEKEEKDKAKKLEIRPAKGVDPNLHMANLLIKRIADILPDVRIDITVDDENYIKSLTISNQIESKSGR